MMPITVTSFDNIYRYLLEVILDEPEFVYESNNKKVYEITNVDFRISNPNNNLVNSKARGFRKEFAQKFFDWIINGESDIKKLYDSNPNAKKFNDETYHRNTAYGPRIVKQLPFIYDELKFDSSSRRAVISILDAEDLTILQDKREGRTNVEYPCTNSIQFLIRENKLHIYVNMRSNNMVTTICYDVYNFTSLQKFVLNELVNFYPTLELGSYTHNIISAHIFEDEVELAKKILKE